MTIQDGDQFFNKRQYDKAINAYNEVISKYGNLIKYPKVDFCEVIEALKKRGDAYLEKARMANDVVEQRRNASKTKNSYDTAAILAIQQQCFTFYQDCINGSNLMDNLLY